MITPAKYKALCMAIGPQKHVASLLGVTHFTLSRRWNPSARIPREAELAVRQLQQPAGWRTIDTAPRDGTEVLVWHPRMAGGSVKACWESGSWEDRNCHAFTLPDDGKALWHPLPPEPLTTGKDDWA